MDSKELKAPPSRVCPRASLCAVGCAALLAAGAMSAADHADSPSQLANPQADINDVYAFMNPNDGEELVLVLTIVPNAAPNSTPGVLIQGDDAAADTFATNINYDFLIENSTRADPTPVENLRLRCTFPSATQISCALGETVVTGTVGDASQTLTADGMRVYAGLRDDPFFFNGPGLNMTLPEGDEFATMSPGAMFQAAADANGGVADSFANQNILAIVLGVDRDLLTANQTAPLLKLWAGTSPQ